MVEEIEGGVSVSWQDISTAPKDRVLLLFGTLSGPGLDESHPEGPRRVVGYWDSMDEAWALTDTPWSGPFFEPTYWAECPPPPGSKD